MESRMDEECLRSIQESTTLAEHFQNIVDDCKVSSYKISKSVIFFVNFEYYRGGSIAIFERVVKRNEVQKDAF